MRYSEALTLIIQGKKDGAGKCVHTDQPLTTKKVSFQHG